MSSENLKSSDDKIQIRCVTKSFRFQAKFRGYTNGTHSKMYVEHNQNDIRGDNNCFIPAIIEVNFPDLVEAAKKLTPGSEIELIVHRKQGSTGLAAEVLELKPIKLLSLPTVTKY